MSIIVKMRKQLAFWWKRSGSDGYGQATYASPVLIRCRWEDGFVDMKGQVGISPDFNSTVYVDREISNGDLLMLVPKGTTEDQAALPHALEVENAPSEGTYTQQNLWEEIWYNPTLDWAIARVDDEGWGFYELGEIDPEDLQYTLAASSPEGTYDPLESDSLFEPEVSTLQTAANPLEFGAAEVKRFHKLPNLKNTKTLLTAYL